MKISSDRTVARGDGAVEALLEQASPRPAPPSEDERVIRDAVRAEWKTVTGKHRSRRRVVRFAIAATVLLAVAVSFNAFRISGIAPVQVATITKSHGSIYLLGEQSELQELANLATISIGQTIITGGDSGIGLEWVDGGSLRVDQNTRIEITSDDAVFLRSGRIYFDSQPSALSSAISSGAAETTAAITGSGAARPALRIETEHGTVTHLGTQYMTYADDQKLIVSVREGRVEIDGLHREEVAEEGKQLTLSGSGRPSLLDINGYSADWEWIEAMAPSADVDGRTVHEFLQWVARETGLDVEYVSAAAEKIAHDGKLIGTVDQRPTKALDFWMQGVDLDWQIEGGIIKVTAIDSGNGR